MIESLVTILRDKHTSLAKFRKCASKLCDLLVYELVKESSEKKITVKSPIKKTKGKSFEEKILLLPILRSGMVFLPSFLKYFEKAHVGFLGIRRDEKTALPHFYYENLPKIKSLDKIIILDPMIATGGSTIASIRKLCIYKVKATQIHIVSIIASKPGISFIRKTYPKIKIHSAAIDPELNEKKFIVPGLGDFGDRFFIS